MSSKARCCRKRVEDVGLLRGFAMSQLVLGSPEHERPPVATRHGVHFAPCQFLEPLLGGEQRSMSAGISPLNTLGW